MKVSVFKICYNILQYDRPINAAARKPLTSDELKNKGPLNPRDPDDPRHRRL